MELLCKITASLYLYNIDTFLATPLSLLQLSAQSIFYGY